jgi:GTP-binding protein
VQEDNVRLGASSVGESTPVDAGTVSVGASSVGESTSRVHEDNVSVGESSVGESTPRVEADNVIVGASSVGESMLRVHADNVSEDASNAGESKHRVHEDNVSMGESNAGESTITNSKSLLRVDADSIRMAIVGRPNVGKSTLTNSIIGESKQLVGDFSGLTRESSEYAFTFADRKLKIIDTCGMRRQARVLDMLERISVSNTKKAYKNADSVVLLMDATSLISGKIEKQDLNLAANIVNSGKSLIIACNKCDKTPYRIDDVPPFIRRNFRHGLSQLKDVPFLFISALRRENIETLLRRVIEVYDKQRRQFKTSDLNGWLQELNRRDLLQSGSICFKMKYITQVGQLPPTFLIFTTNRDRILESHRRFINTDFKRAFDMQDALIHIKFVDNRDHGKPSPTQMGRVQQRGC